MKKQVLLMEKFRVRFEKRFGFWNSLLHIDFNFLALNNGHKKELNIFTLCIIMTPLL